MKILCTSPGRNGDILWQLPTIRAISHFYDQPVDLQIGGEFTGIVPLLAQQPYLGKVWADPAWAMVPPEEWRAPAVEGYDHIYHAGYRGWPELPLPFWTEHGVKQAYPELAGMEVDYLTPWITLHPGGRTSIFPLVCGWSDEWFELKYGITRLVAWQQDLCVVCPAGSRWDVEAASLAVYPTTWEQAANRIAQADVFLGCCSALHVLAVALGKPGVLMEPSEARWNDIFYPMGMDGPRVTVVKGNTHLPTFDARAVAEAIQTKLRSLQ